MFDSLATFLEENGFHDMELYSLYSFPSEPMGLLSESSIFLLKNDIFVFGMTFFTYDHDVIYIEKLDSSGFYSEPGLCTTVVQGVLKEFSGKTVHIFARAQPQLLFPESVKNQDKKIKSERKLVAWWAKTLVNSTLKGHYYVPGESSTSIKDISSILDKNWEFGWPWDLDSCISSIPIFPDDVKFKALKLLDSKCTIRDFQNILQVTGECGSGRFSGFFIFKTPSNEYKGVFSSQLKVEDYKKFFKILMDSDFSNKDLALASSAKLKEFLLASGVSPQKLDGSSKVKKEKKRECDSTVVVLASNLIKKKKL